jgi:hypothetical protein
MSFYVSYKLNFPARECEPDQPAMQKGFLPNPDLFEPDVGKGLSFRVRWSVTGMQDFAGITVRTRISVSNVAFHYCK